MNETENRRDAETQSSDLLRTPNHKFAAPIEPGQSTLQDNVRASQQQRPTEVTGAGNALAEGAQIGDLLHTINKLQEALHYQTESRRLCRDLQEDWWDLKHCLEERVRELAESERVYMECLARANAKLRLAGIAAVAGPELSALAVKHGMTPDRVEPQGRRDAEGASAPATIEKSDCDEDEDLIQNCIEAIRLSQTASISFLQRQFRLGYTRGARIMDELVRRGVVGDLKKDSNMREILIPTPGPSLSLHSMTVPEVEYPGGRFASPEKGGV